MDGGQRIVVGVTGSVGNLQALRYAAAEARRRETPLLAVHAWVPPGGELAERQCAVPELRQVWQEAAWRRLWDAFDAALGGMPADLPVEATAVRGDPGRVLVATADRHDDLLVVGAGRREFLAAAAPAGKPLLPDPRGLPRSRRAAERAGPGDERLHAWIVRRRALLPGKNELSGHHG